MVLINFYRMHNTSIQAICTRYIYVIFESSMYGYMGKTLLYPRAYSPSQVIVESLSLFERKENKNKKKKKEKSASGSY